MAGGAAAVVGELTEVSRRLVAADPHELSEGALVEGLDALLEAERLLHAAQVRWLAAAEARDATVGVCGRSTRNYLIEEHQLAPKDAGARLKLARTLACVPAVDAAFTAGQLTADQASVIVAACLDTPVEVRDTVAEQLVTLAESMPPFALARAVDTILTTIGVDTDAAQAHAERRLARRHVHLDAGFDGTGHLSGLLTPDTYDALRLAVTTASAPGTFGEDDDRSAGQRRHDALGVIARFYLDHAALPAVNAERPRVVVTMTARSLVDPQPGTPDDGWGTLDSGVPVPPDTARRIACDAQLLPVIVSPAGDVLDLGRTTRVWSNAIRRAAWIRDAGRCAFPSCRRPPAELHHILWWSHGGRTSLDNAAWLCTFHHWLVHEGRWTLRRDPDRRYVFTAPDGREFGHPPHSEAA